MFLVVTHVTQDPSTLKFLNLNSQLSSNGLFPFSKAVRRSSYLASEGPILSLLLTKPESRAQIQCHGQ